MIMPQSRNMPIEVRVFLITNHYHAFVLLISTFRISVKNIVRRAFLEDPLCRKVVNDPAQRFGIGIPVNFYMELFLSGFPGFGTAWQRHISVRDRDISVSDRHISVSERERYLCLRERYLCVREISLSEIEISVSERYLCLREDISVGKRHISVLDISISERR